jgi:mono/diheme cytochrome c family protein
MTRTSTRALYLAAILTAATLASAQDAPRPIAAWSRTAAISESAGSLRERGAAVFNNWCDACHRRSEINAPGTRSLEFKYRGELPAALEDREDLTPELVEFYVRNGVATMPFYRPTEISDDDLEALGAYLSAD